MSDYGLDKYGEIMTPKDVHDVLKIGFNKTYELLRLGELKSFKIGRSRKIPKSSLIDYIDRSMSVETDIHKIKKEND